MYKRQQEIDNQVFLFLFKTSEQIVSLPQPLGPDKTINCPFSFNLIIITPSLLIERLYHLLEKIQRKK